jgi:hypothetical protein
MRATFIIATATGFGALSSFSGPAWAQANRTFVSGHGSDTNPCSLTAPCRSFAQALTQTSAGGEITILDPAGYGSVTINKSVSIINDGVGEAGITVTSPTVAITVSVGAGDIVNLRGLTLVGSREGVHAIQFNNLGELNIQNCVIRDFHDRALDLEPAGSATFNVSDTIVSNADSSAVSLLPSGVGGVVTAAFNRVQAISSGDGFEVNGSNSVAAVNVTIANSAATNNNTVGIAVASNTGKALTQVMVSNTVISNNGTGVLDDGANSMTYLAKNTIAGNSMAFNVINGSLFSFGDNYIRSNTNDGGTITLVAAK